MKELHCHACGMAVTPNAVYCSTCGRLLVRQQPAWYLRGWGWLLTIMHVVSLLYIVGFSGYVALPVAVRIAPPCGIYPSTLAVIPRTLGVVVSQRGLVGGQAVLQAGDCNTAVSAWYTITTTQPALFAAARRDVRTWSGWLVATSEGTLGAVTQISGGVVRAVFDTVVYGYQRIVAD